jgi:CubicO group peptidase (beta-lactamase class C family)
MWLFVSVWRPILHPDAKKIPSVTYTTPSPEWSAAVDRAREAIRAGIVEQNLPGLSVAVGAGGTLAWAEGFGWADVEARPPVTPETRFPIGTASTVLTSAAAGVLLEKGRLTLDDEIQTYVPQFPKKQWPVTLRQLMADVGGVGTDSGVDGPLFRQRCERPAEALPAFEQDALLFEPGTQHRRSKYGWILVSAAVESAGGQPFFQFLRERIFQPLRMGNTGAESPREENPDRVGEAEEDPPIIGFVTDVILQPLGLRGSMAASARAAGRAKLYTAGFGPRPVFRYGLHPMRPQNLSCYAGSMAFFSTPSDLARFGLAIQGGALPQSDTARLLLTPQGLASGQGTGHGLGWDLETVTLGGRPTQAAGYDGELLGRRIVSLRIFRDAGIVVAVMSNLSDADTPGLARKVAEAFAGNAHQ